MDGASWTTHHQSKNWGIQICMAVAVRTEAAAVSIFNAARSIACEGRTAMTKWVAPQRRMKVANSTTRKT